MRINQLPAATEVAQNDVLAIDTSNGTYQVPRSVLAPSPYIATIPTGQWSGSDNDYYITVTASNVTADSFLYPFFDSASEALLNGPVWAVPAAGSFTIHTSAIPSDTVTISVLLAGVVGEAQYQVLADVYSTSQVDSIVAQSTAATAIIPTAGTNVTINDCHCYTSGKLACINISFTMAADASSTQVLLSGLPIPKTYVPVIAVRNLGGGGFQCNITISGNLANNYDGFTSGKKYFINCCYAIA